MSNLILLRGGSESEWTAADPILAAREVGVTTDTHRLKVGDGVLAWSELPYVDEAGAGGSLTLADDDVTLPAADVLGRVRVIKNVGTVPIDVSAVDLIDGFGSHTLNPQEALTVTATGETWVIV